MGSFGVTLLLCLVVVSWAFSAYVVSKYKRLQNQESWSMDIVSCKVGDVVELKACCECISNTTDKKTGAFNCPFSKDCEFDECCNGNERTFRTTVESIYTTGHGWHVTLKDINIEIPLEDVWLGKSIRVVTERNRFRDQELRGGRWH